MGEWDIRNFCFYEVYYFVGDLGNIYLGNSYWMFGMCLVFLRSL